MVEITYQMLLSTLQTLSLLVGVIYYITIMRNNQRTRELSLKAQELALETRQAQLFMHIYDRFNETEFSTQWTKIMFQWRWKDFEEWWQKYGPEENVEENASFVSVIRYYEGVGVLVKKGLIDINIVGELMSTHIIRFWEKMEPVFKALRERLNWPELFQEFEYLYNEIKPITEQQHPELNT